MYLKKVPFFMYFCLSNTRIFYIILLLRIEFLKYGKKNILFVLRIYENDVHALIARIFYAQCREPSSMYFM